MPNDRTILITGVTGQQGGAVRGRARQNRATAGREGDTTRRRDRVRAPRCGPGLERHRRELARGSWDVAQRAGSGKTQTTRQDRASCGLEIAYEIYLQRGAQPDYPSSRSKKYDDDLRNHRQHTPRAVL